MSDYSLYIKAFAKLWPGLVTEFRFAPPRRWRFDLAWPDRMLAMEIEGGTWVSGRHTRGKGYLNDLEKYNEAVILGWRLLRVTPQMLRDGTATVLLERISNGQSHQD